LICFWSVSSLGLTSSPFPLSCYKMCALNLSDQTIIPNDWLCPCLLKHPKIFIRFLRFLVKKLNVNRHLSFIMSWLLFDWKVGMLLDKLGMLLNTPWMFDPTWGNEFKVQLRSPLKNNLNLKIWTLVVKSLLWHCRLYNAHAYIQRECSAL